MDRPCPRGVGLPRRETRPFDLWKPQRSVSAQTILSRDRDGPRGPKWSPCRVPVWGGDHGVSTALAAVGGPESTEAVALSWCLRLDFVLGARGTMRLAEKLASLLGPGGARSSSTSAKAFPVPPEGAEFQGRLQGGARKRPRRKSPEAPASSHVLEFVFTWTRFVPHASSWISQ